MAKCQEHDPAWVRWRLQKSIDALEHEAHCCDVKRRRLIQQVRRMRRTHRHRRELRRLKRRAIYCRAVANGHRERMPSPELQEA